MFSLQLTHPSPYNNHWYSSVCFTDPRTVGFIMGRYRSNIKHLAHSLRLKYHQSVWIDYINQPTPNPYAPNVLSPPHWIITSNSPYVIQEAITSILLKSQHRLIQINSTQPPPPTTPPPIHPTTWKVIRYRRVHVGRNSHRFHPGRQWLSWTHPTLGLILLREQPKTIFFY